MLMLFHFLCWLYGTFDNCCCFLSPLLTLGFCHTSWAARVHCRMSDGRTWTDACWVEPGKPTGKGKARSSVQLKDATRCQKIMHLKKLPSTCQKAYIISPKTSQFHPHPGPTQVCVRPDVAPPPAWVDLTPWLGRDNCASLPARTLFKFTVSSRSTNVHHKNRSLHVFTASDTYRFGINEGGESFQHVNPFCFNKGANKSWIFTSFQLPCTHLRTRIKQISWFI